MDESVKVREVPNLDFGGKKGDRRILSTKVPMELRRAVLVAAVEREITVQLWVEEAVREALDAVGGGNPPEAA